MIERVRAEAPSNIALVKYMGKLDGSLNIPANSSLSMTLSGLKTVAEARWNSEGSVPVRWVPGFQGSDLRVSALSSEAAARIEKHTARVRAAAHDLLSEGGIDVAPDWTKGTIEFCAVNTFPASSGIASSASSFAAITLAVVSLHAQSLARFREIAERPAFRARLARLSRQGSGSSCRSFQGPWVFWSGENPEQLVSRLPAIVDLVLLVDSAPKRVGSSEAHARVRTSPLWNGRVERVNARAGRVIQALAQADWSRIAHEAWSELWEMHSLFHTSDPPFTYWKPRTLDLLEWLRPGIEQGQDGSTEMPIVTMDAGPNLHVLIEATRADEWRRKIEAAFPGLPILADTQGTGAHLVEAP